MTLVFIFIITSLIIAFIVVSVFFYTKRKKEKAMSYMSFVKDALDKKGFYYNEILPVNHILAIAVNKKNTILAVVTKDHSGGYNYEEINSYFMTGIEKNPKDIIISYVSGNAKKILSLNFSKKAEELIYELYKNAYVRRLAQKYDVKNYTLTSGSDWNCSYVWAYSRLKNIFAYYKTTDRIAFYKLNLLKEFFTLDTKFNYFQAPIMGVDRQISAYEKSFFDELFKHLFESIRQKASPILKDKLFFDNYNNIVYLSNGINSIQSIIIDKIEEVYYNDNKLTFSLKDSEKNVNYLADRTLIEEFDNFVTSYNLRNIASSFNYSTDKLINVTDSTKFIFDFTRDRVIYCANLNKFAGFSYITIAFSNLKEAKIEKSGENHFVRINTKNKDTIDISCKKASVAQYVMAQLITIINN